MFIPPYLSGKVSLGENSEGRENTGDSVFWGVSVFEPVQFHFQELDVLGQILS